MTPDRLELIRRGWRYARTCWNPLIGKSYTVRVPHPLSLRAMDWRSIDAPVRPEPIRAAEVEFRLGVAPDPLTGELVRVVRCEGVVVEQIDRSDGRPLYYRNGWR